MGVGAPGTGVATGSGLGVAVAGTGVGVSSSPQAAATSSTTKRMISVPRNTPRRVAAFLDIAVPEAAWPGLADTVSIETMRANADKILGLHEDHFKGGGKTFLHKGTNGRWREVLDDADLARYRAAMEKTLDGDAAAWLEQGGPVA